MKNKWNKIVSILLATAILLSIMTTNIVRANTLEEKDLEIIWLEKGLSAVSLWEGLVLVKKNGKYGYLDATGKTVIPAIYDRVANFGTGKEGISIVSKEGKTGVIDAKGNEIIPVIYEEVGYVAGDLIAVKKEGKTGVIDAKGNEIIPIIYEEVERAEEGLIAVKKDGKWGYVDITGKQIIPIILEKVYHFQENIGLVEKDGKKVYIDKTGKILLEVDYDHAGYFYDGLGLVRNDNDEKGGYMDITGKVVIPMIYDEVYGFNKGLSMVKNDKKYGYIDKTGKIVVPIIYDKLSRFADGLAAAGKDGKYGFIDKTGKEVIPMKYDDTDDFSDGLACVSKDGKYGYIDKSGKEVIATIYDSLSLGSDGFIWFRKDGKAGLIDKNGKEVVPAIYEHILDFSEGLALVKDKGYGYIDTKGNRVIPTIFVYATSFSKGVALVVDRKDYRHGILKNPLKKTSVKSPAISPALESFVRQAIGKLTGELTDSDWNQLTSLDLTGASLENLEGLEKAGNLKEINLSFALITDISALEGSTNLKKIILTNSRLTKLQIDHLKSKLPQVEWMVKEVSITDPAVKNWNIAQTGDDLSGSAEQIIAEAGKQEVKAADGMVVIDKKLTESGLAKAVAVKEQLYAKAAGENKELNKALDTVVKVELEQAGSGRTEMNIRIAKEVKDLKEVDKLMVEVDSEISLEISSEQLQENITVNDLEISIEEVKKDSGFLPHAQGERGEIQIGFGGEGESFKRYRIKMKKGKNDAKIGISLKSPDSPYTAIFRKTDKGEEVIGGKYDAKTKKLTVKVGEDGEYYVKKNEKNFSDIEKLSGVQKEMIKVLASKGILKGDEKGRFNPNAGISRSELLTILVRLSYVYDDKAISNFSDVKAGSWYYPFVSSGQKIGVVNGYPDNTFKPENPVGAAELAKMNTMMLVYKKGYHFPQKNDLYLAKLAKSSNIPEWAVSYIAMAEREGFLLKNSSGVYDGTKTMTREEAAEMLYRLWEKL